jgi:hypothetical protein
VRVKINMIKKLGFATAFLAAALAFTPRPAEAKWHAGVYVGPSFYGYGYPYYGYYPGPYPGYYYPGYPGYYWGGYWQHHHR